MIELSEKFAAAKAAWAERRARYADKLREERTLSGIPLKTVYTQEDLDERHLDELPGVYPFTRGLYPDGYALTPWMQQMVFGYGTIEETREKMEKMVAEGMEGYFGHKVFNTVYDIPCMYGIDADHPEAAGNLGQCGVHMSTGRRLRRADPRLGPRADQLLDDHGRQLPARAGAAHRGRRAPRRGPVEAARQLDELVPADRGAGHPVLGAEVGLRAPDRPDQVLRAQPAALEPGQHLHVRDLRGRRDACAGARLRARVGQVDHRRGPRGRPRAGRVRRPAVLPDRLHRQPLRGGREVPGAPADVGQALQRRRLREAGEHARARPRPHLAGTS